jgi:alpha-ketoglutarate-dependent taurine dioxygenase
MNMRIMQPTGLQTTPLHKSLGLEVHGVDLSKQLGKDVTEHLDDLLSEHCVLLFRQQLLSEEDLVRFAGAFGELERTIYTKGVSPYQPEVIYISNLKYPDGSNLGLLGDQEVDWHSDQTYRTRPATGSMLYGLEVTSSGRTYWANQYAAYEALSADVRASIEGRTGIFSYAKRLEVFYPKDQKDDQDLKKRAPQVAEHPIVLTHPVTGRKALYADPVTLLEIKGVPKDENERLLKVLAERCAITEVVYEHSWRQGDVVFWDNGCTLHRRDPIAADRARFMKRMTIFLRGERHCLPR